MSPLGSSLTIFFISPRTSFTHLGIMQKPQPGFGCLRMCFILLFASVPFPSLPFIFSLLCFLPSSPASFLSSFSPAHVHYATLFFPQNTMRNGISLHMYHFFKHFTHFKIFPWFSHLIFYISPHEIKQSSHFYN